MLVQSVFIQRVFLRNVPDLHELSLVSLFFVEKAIIVFQRSNNNLTNGNLCLARPQAFAEVVEGAEGAAEAAAED